MTREQFEHDLAQISEFDFDWTWGHDGCHVGTPDGDRASWTKSDRDYVDAVLAAQERAEDAMDEARAAYSAGDITSARKAIDVACSAEAEFGDCPTYKHLWRFLTDQEKHMEG